MAGKAAAAPAAAPAAKPAATAGERPPVLEWIMAALGALITLIALGLLLRDAHRAPTPPQLTAHLVEARPLGAAAWAAEVEVINRGDETAARVRVRAEAAGQVSEAEADYVAGHGSARLTLVLPADPAGAVLTVRGWSEP